MINNIKLKKRFNTSVLMVSVFMLSIFMTSCEFELPEEGSKGDDTPPVAYFEAAASTVDGYLTYNFSNQSSSATDYAWDFGDGNTSTEFEPTHVYAATDTDLDGTPYTVTLTVMDKLLVTSISANVITVLEPAEEPAINPELINGDFTEGQDDWKISTFTGGDRSAFNSSSDGSSLLYDGTESGASKTPGAKYTSSTSAQPEDEKTRHAYQAVTVTPNTEYVLEFQYAIKTDKDDIDGGDRIIGEILSGSYSDGADAVAASASGDDTIVLGQIVGDVANGKGNFETARLTFTSNDSGQISIWIYAITNDELYADNVKLYPLD